MAALALVPLGFVVAYTIIIGPHDAFDLLWRPRIGMLLWNTGRLVVGGIVASTLLGLACAWLVARTDLPGRRLLHGLFVAPLAVPAFVNSYSWVSITFWVQQYAGAVLVVTLSYFPLVYLPVVASLRGLDPALEESAASLGYNGRRTFLRVVLPQLAPALLGGALLVGLHLLSEFGALRMLNFPTFTTAIYDQYRSTFNGHAANMIAGVLVLACALLLTAELRLRGHKRYARLGGGAARPIEPFRLGVYKLPMLLFSALVVALGVGIPCYSLVHWLAVGSSTSFQVGDLTSATVNSLGLGAAGAVVTVLAALPVAWLVVRFRRPMTTILERSTYVPNALPGIVVALALVTVSIRAFPSIYQTYVLLVAAYVILSLPRAVVSVRSALEQAPAVLDDVSHSLGVGPIATARRVTLPLIAPGIGAGAALVFLAVATELTATLMLAPIGTTTLATEFWSASSGVEYGRAAPYALLLVLISVPATILLAREASSSHRHERGSR